MYICETFRQNRGVEDNRGHMDWLDDDLAAQTLEDRLAYFTKHLGDRASRHMKPMKIVSLRLADTDGDRTGRPIRCFRGWLQPRVGRDGSRSISPWWRCVLHLHTGSMEIERYQS